MKCSSIIWLLLLGSLLRSCSNPFPYSDPSRYDDPYADSRRVVVDSLSLNKDKGIYLYKYYFSAGVVGRMEDDFLGINSCSCRLKADSNFFAAPEILKIEQKGDTIIAIIAQTKYKMLHPISVPFKVIIDSATWRYAK